MRQIKNKLSTIWNPLHFAYLLNWFTGDVISTIFHLTLSHFNKNRQLFENYLSWYQFGIQHNSPTKMSFWAESADPQTPPYVFGAWTFWMGGPQWIHMTCNITTLNTSVPHGCMLCPLQFMLLTHECAERHSSNRIKFADDTTLADHIRNNDESACREEVEQIAGWCVDKKDNPKSDKSWDIMENF